LPVGRETVGFLKSRQEGRELEEQLRKEEA
jgi:hypothetical protein